METEKRQLFINWLTGKYPEVDAERALECIEREIGKIKLTGPDDNHPNKALEFPINSDIVKAIFVASIRNYIEVKQGWSVLCDFDEVKEMLGFPKNCEGWYAVCEPGGLPVLTTSAKPGTRNLTKEEFISTVYAAWKEKPWKND